MSDIRGVSCGVHLGRVVAASTAVVAATVMGSFGSRRRSRIAERNVRKSSSGGPVRNARASAAGVLHEIDGEFGHRVSPLLLAL
jgi:hypothetical protein